MNKFFKLKELEKICQIKIFMNIKKDIISY